MPSLVRTGTAPKRKFCSGEGLGRWPPGTAQHHIFDTRHRLCPTCRIHRLLTLILTGTLADTCNSAAPRMYSQNSPGDTPHTPRHQRRGRTYPERTASNWPAPAQAKNALGHTFDNSGRFRRPHRARCPERTSARIHRRTRQPHKIHSLTTRSRSSGSPRGMLCTAAAQRHR